MPGTNDTQRDNLVEPADRAQGHDGGWPASAPAWIKLIDAGEDHRTLLLDRVMLEQCGDVDGLKVLDVGCGEGRFCRMLAERGAAVSGIDPTSLLIATAFERDAGGHYAAATAASLPFDDGSFDLIVSYLSMVDIADYRGAINEAARVLRPRGRLVVANLGFVTASEGWARNEAGRRLYHRIDRYAEERPIVLDTRGVRITNWHRPLSAYMTAYLAAGLRLTTFLEPMPPDGSLRDDPRFEDWYRVPVFNVMVWVK